VNDEGALLLYQLLFSSNVTLNSFFPLASPKQIRRASMQDAVHATDITGRDLMDISDIQVRHPFLMNAALLSCTRTTFFIFYFLF
jgi:hypothetical protein